MTPMAIKLALRHPQAFGQSPTMPKTVRYVGNAAIRSSPWTLTAWAAASSTREEVNGVVTKHHKFVYDNYLCVQKVDALNNNSQINLFVWDPTEPIATRPLFTQRGTGYKFFYTFDGNKNVSELVHFETRNGIAAHYDYAPFGAVTRAISASAVTDNTFTTDNPFRFSSEYHDDTLGLVYYNYRHYNPVDGRWCGRDPMEDADVNRYLFLKNSPSIRYDEYGMLWRATMRTYMSVWENVKDVYNAVEVLVQGYLEMREANTIGADKWFHCVAMCEAARFSVTTTEFMSALRETTDFYKFLIEENTDITMSSFVEYLNAIMSDLVANYTGITCRPPKRCKDCCCKFEPNGLDVDRWMN